MFSAVTAWSSRRPTGFGALAFACALALMPLACAVHAASVAGPGQAPAFDVVIAAIPGYGFSGKPTQPGWNPERMAKAWDVLMKRLGYTHYVSQGGDHGSVISDALARQAPKGLLGIHLNMPATIPANLVKGINSGDPAPAHLSADERRAYNQLSSFFGRNAAYGAMMVTRPQTIGYALADSSAASPRWSSPMNTTAVNANGSIVRAAGEQPSLDVLSVYATSGGVFFIVQAALLAWRAHQRRAVLD